METILFILLSAAALWASVCLAFLAMMLFTPSPVAAYTGFRIVIPSHYRVLLDEAEYHAIYLHECGHRHHGHVWRNYARFCLFRPASAQRLRQQEREADEYAFDRGYGPPLARAIRKLHPPDCARARRLESMLRPKKTTVKTPV